ncbi:D-hexose-6-phosphate mutarotase [Aquabacterium sp.]|uniref:D-hexose-6-phosphate mutarotase n=1 Tax=Aquabacterium sp. TaxID=1872578 RepID=UPI0027B9A731|nr:D-hexose-6-phosphate mutarotase [Aquabacterium sp.]
MSETMFDMIEVQGQPAVRVQSPDGAQATVLLHGAQVISWVPACGANQLYLSPEAVIAPGHAVRGGVPVVFPQFAQRGPDTSLPRHGLLRTRAWTVESSRQEKDHAQLTLVFDDTAETRALWPHSFTTEMTVSVSNTRLDLELYVQNPGQTPWSFTAALHTYLAVSDVTQARLLGLEGRPFEDTVLDERHIEDHPEKRFYGEFDRIYSGVKDLLLRDGPRRVNITQSGWPDAVIWNPGPQKCAALADMPADDWQGMLCVEAAAVFEPITLGAEEEWSGRQSLVLLTE